MKSAISTFYALPTGPIVRTVPISAHGVTPGIPYILEAREGHIRNYSKNGVVSDWDDDVATREFIALGIRTGRFVETDFPSNFSSRSLEFVDFDEKEDIYGKYKIT